MSGIVGKKRDADTAVANSFSAAVQRMAAYDGRIFASRMEYAMKTRNSNNEVDIERVRKDALGRIGKELEKQPGWIDFGSINRDVVMLRYLNDGDASAPLREMVKKLRERIATEPKIGDKAQDVLDVMKCVARNCGRNAPVTPSAPISCTW